MRANAEREKQFHEDQKQLKSFLRQGLDEHDQKEMLNMQKLEEINKKSIIKGLQFYDDEQRLIIMALHYNANLKRNLQNKQAIDNLFYLCNSAQVINLSSNWLSAKA